jgi:cytidyltransferase-like protein
MAGAMNKVAVSGYFNPIHIGHVRMLEKAKSLGDYLVVIVNNDNQVKLKGSVPFMKEAERLEIIKAIKFVDEVVLSIDKDRTVCETLSKVKPNIFANGGDRDNAKELPEAKVCEENNIKILVPITEPIIETKINFLKIFLSKSLKLPQAIYTDETVPT